MTRAAIVSLATAAAFAAFGTVAGAAQTRGAISGCVVDDSALALPGTTITASGPGGALTAVTDPRGCYRVPNVPAGRYTVTAVLAAFRTVVREDIRVAEGETAIVNLEMSPSGIVEIDWFVTAGGLAGLWNEADAVARIRIERSVQPDGRSFTEHTAAIAEVFKWPVALKQDERLVFRQERWAGEKAPYPVGQDLVVFLSWRRGTFYRTAGWFGAFLVYGDRVRNVDRDTSPETTADLLARLRSLAGR